MSPPLTFRIRHQLRAEWRHHRAWVFAWWLWLLLRHATLERSTAGHTGPVFFADDVVLVVTPLLAAALVWRCIRADSPSNTDSAVLTRPLGQQALWLAKVAFLLLGLFLPFLLAEMATWTGFAQPFSAWVALAAGVLLAGVLVVGVVGAATALTRTSAQVIAIAVVGMLGAGFMLTLGFVLLSGGGGMAAPLTIKDGARASGLCVAMLAMAGGSVFAWWVATVPRRRGWAAALLVLSLLQAPWVAAAWRLDWLTPPPQAYPPGRLAVKTGKADPADKAPGRALWPTLRITGLGRDEVASIVDFAPVAEGTAAWPPLGSHTDLTRDLNANVWLNDEHIRALQKHSPAATLWHTMLFSSSMYQGRPAVANLLGPLHVNPNNPPGRWRLRLAVHEMRRVATLPCSQLWERDSRVPLQPGVQVEFRRMEPWFANWILKGCIRHRHPYLTRPTEHMAPISQGEPLPVGLLLVFEDPELRENLATSVALRPMNQLPGLHTGTAHEFSIVLNYPRLQHLLLKTTQADWVRRTQMAVWVAEDRGTVDLELTAEQMAQVLAP